MEQRRKVTLDLLDALHGVECINSVERRMRSERGMNTSVVRVNSDRPSAHEIWSEGTTIAWQRVKADPLTYVQRKAREARDARGNVPYEGETCWPYSTFKTRKQRVKGVPRPESVSIVLPDGVSALEFIFGV